MRKKTRERETGEETAGKRSHLLLSVIIFLIMVITIIWMGITRAGGLGKGWPLGLYSTLLLIYLCSKMMLAFSYRPFRGKVRRHSISAIIPNYNEAPEALVATITSLMEGTRVPDEVFVIDDGSQDTAGYHAAKALEKKYSNLAVHRLEENVGKRRAQGWAFRRMKGELVLTVDSDTIYDKGAVAAMEEAFNQPEVMAVGGQIRARNRCDNLLTRLLDMRYHNAYQVERAAQSVSGAMLCCSGPIAMYRREIIDDNLEDYENQRYLGVIVTTGDDRRLTQYALQRGLVRYQARATCATASPSTLKVFIKQQIRWTKSFFRESGESVIFAIRHRKYTLLMWTILELSLWIVFTMSVLLAPILGTVHIGTFWSALLYLSLAAWARNVMYLHHPMIFLMAPLYGIFHLMVLFPVRLYALATMKDTRWGTR